MKNFYEEHEGYKALQNKLDWDMTLELINVVGDAISFGITSVGERQRKEREDDTSRACKKTP